MTAAHVIQAFSSDNVQHFAEESTENTRELIWLHAQIKIKLPTILRRVH